MAISPKLSWPFPDENDLSWYSKFVSLMQAMDATAYAGREDRSVIVTKGGTMSWNSTSSTLTWGAGIDILSPISGFLETIAAASITITDGQCWYVQLSRAPSGAISLTSAVANSIPNTDDAYILAIRHGTSLYFRNGSVLAGNSIAPVFDGGTSKSSYVFLYTATGAEGTSFTVTIPVARLSTTYVVTSSLMGVATKFTMDIAYTSNTLSTFHVSASVAPTAGDKIAFVINDLS